MNLESFVLVLVRLEGCNFVRNLYSVFLDSSQDCASYFGGQRFGWIDALALVWKELDEHGRRMGRGVGYRRCDPALSPDLIERRKHRIAANRKVLIILRSSFDSRHNHRSGKPGVLQDPAAD